ncbi:unnamed protein product, partial [Ectocarpus sp. 12 AP-2014]
MLRKRGPLLLATLLQQPCSHGFVHLTTVGNRAQHSTSSALPPARTTAIMGPKRGGYWQRKKDERSRSFSKRGRVGGWGDYGSDGPMKAGSGSQ